MPTNMEIDENLARRLAVLRNQPRRNPEKAVAARAAFLDQAQIVANSSSPAVTTTENRRHIGWMHLLQQLFRVQKKEHSPMFGTLGTILLIFSLVLGGSGATVAAAQNSLPDHALYPVKTWSEDVRMGLTSNTQTRLELALDFTNRRAEEMQMMLQAGEVPSEAVQTRMQAEIDQALQLAAGQPDHEAVMSLEQIRQQLQVHEQALMKLEPGAGTQTDAILDQTRTMLQDRLQVCDQGIQDPVWLRQHIRDRDQLHDGTDPNADQTPSGAGNPWVTGTPTSDSGYGPGPADDSGGNNPWTTGTPTPGSSYGTGPRDGAGEPGGNNPWTTGSPTPGSSYGPGPGDGTGEPGGAGEPGGNENPGGNGTGTGSGSPQDDNGNGTGSPGSGESDGGAGQGSDPSDGGSNESGNSDSGGGDSGSGGGTGSDGSGSGGSGGKP